MTREQFEDAKNAVEKAENLIHDIDYLTKKLNDAKEQIYNIEGIEIVGKTQQYHYILHQTLGDFEFLKVKDYHTEDCKKLVEDIIKILEDRIEVLNSELESLPPYHSKLDCLKSLIFDETSN